MSCVDGDIGGRCGVDGVIGGNEGGGVVDKHSQEVYFEREIISGLVTCWERKCIACLLTT